jgi:MFS family permease
LTGGVVISYYGGVHTKKAREAMLIAGWVCIVITIPMPGIDSFLNYGICLFVLFFLGGSLLPSLTCLMLASVPESKRGSANSIAVFAYNMFGWMPAPFIYGVVSKFSDNKSSRYPMIVILYSGFVTLTIMTIVILRKFRSESLD